jgi:hypothetical integral membrane protein (TIGR02206 family)
VAAFAGLDRLAPLGVTLLLSVTLCVAARRWPGSWRLLVGRGLALVLVANLAIWQIVTVHGGSWDPAADAMVDLCPVTAVIAAVALWRPPRPLLVELTYFWGCAGTIQGVLTPDPRWHYPSYFYFQFYVTHVGVVLAAVFLVLGLGITPRRHAVPRVFLLTLAFAAVAALTDIVTGGNYMFLRDKGPAGTLLDVMGPWPWYIATGILLALVFLLILDTPFRIARSRGRDQPPAVSEQAPINLSGAPVLSPSTSSLSQQPGKVGLSRLRR